MAAFSAAEAATIVVYFMAPGFSRSCMVRAMLEFFWPIATYIE